METIAQRILIVDDELIVREPLKELFSDRGWDVETASCGQEALGLLSQAEPFDVIIADYYMPHLNGLEFLKRVNLKYPGTYCIMLTAYPFCDSVKYALKKYLNADILEKPWDEQMVDTVELVMKSRKAYQAQEIS